MRLRELRPNELVEVELRCARVRAALEELREPWNPGPAAVAAAPYLDQWEVRPYPGTGKPCLQGICYGHPRFGDTVVNTSPIAHCGPGWAITEGSNRLYVLGREDRQHKRARILSGRRGAFRPPMAVPPTPSTATDDDLPALEGTM